MDSCVGVGQDLDKAILKFYNLNDHTSKAIQDIIDQVENLRKELSKREYFVCQSMFNFMCTCGEEDIIAWLYMILMLSSASIVLNIQILSLATLLLSHSTKGLFQLFLVFTVPPPVLTSLLSLSAYDLMIYPLGLYEN